MAKKKGVNSLAFLVDSNAPKSSGDIEKLLQGRPSETKDLKLAEDVEKEAQTKETATASGEELEKEKAAVLEPELQDNKPKVPVGVESEKNSPKAEQNNIRKPLEDFLIRPTDFVKEKTENLAVNTSQRDMLKLLATIEGTQLNILVYNILDDFLQAYGIKELSSIIEKKKRRIK